MSRKLKKRYTITSRNGNLIPLVQARGMRASPQGEEEVHPSPEEAEEGGAVEAETSNSLGNASTAAKRDTLKLDAESHSTPRDEETLMKREDPKEGTIHNAKGNNKAPEREEKSQSLRNVRQEGTRGNRDPRRSEVDRGVDSTSQRRTWRTATRYVCAHLLISIAKTGIEKTRPAIA